MDDIFEQMKELIEELESDSFLKRTQEWSLVEDRYNENLEKLKELIEIV